MDVTYGVCSIIHTGNTFKTYITERPRQRQRQRDRARDREIRRWRETDIERGKEKKIHILPWVVETSFLAFFTLSLTTNVLQEIHTCWYILYLIKEKDIY